MLVVGIITLIVVYQLLSDIVESSVLLLLLLYTELLLLWSLFMCTYLHTYKPTYIPTYIHTYVHTYIRTYVRTYVHTYIHMYTVCIYIYMIYIYIYILSFSVIVLLINIDYYWLLLLCIYIYNLIVSIFLDFGSQNLPAFPPYLERRPGPCGALGSATSLQAPRPRQSHPGKRQAQRAGGARMSWKDGNPKDDGAFNQQKEKQHCGIIYTLIWLIYIWIIWIMSYYW